MIDRDRPLLLGSGSPRRREILQTLGIPLAVRPVDIDESVLGGEGAEAYLERIVATKLEAALALAGQGGDVGGVIVADTSVLLDQVILGKPGDEAEARAMLRALSGRAHEVWTRFGLSGGYAETVRTKVVFRALSDDAIARYAATGEGLDKAGGYAIQGLGAFAVERIEGSYSNVVGLPASEVVAAMLRTGLIAAFPLTPGGA